MTTKKKSARTIAASVRRNQIVKLKLVGLDDLQIADNLNITPARVRSEYKKQLQRLNDDSNDAVRTIRDTTHQRYENLLRILYPKVMQDPIDYEALSQILRIIEGERKLFGIDSEQSQIHIDARQQTFTLDETQDYQKELKRRIANYLQGGKEVIESSTEG